MERNFPERRSKVSIQCGDLCGDWIRIPNSDINMEQLSQLNPLDPESVASLLRRDSLLTFISAELRRPPEAALS